MKEAAVAELTVKDSSRQEKMLQEIREARKVIETSRQQIMELKVLITAKEARIYECLDRMTGG